MEVKAPSLRKVVGAVIKHSKGLPLHLHPNNTMKDQEEEVTRVEEPGPPKDHKDHKEAREAMVVVVAVAVGCHNSSNIVMLGPRLRRMNIEVGAGVVREEEAQIRQEEVAAVMAAAAAAVVAVGEEDLLMLVVQPDHQFPTCTKRPLLHMLPGSPLSPQAPQPMHPIRPMSLSLQNWYSLFNRFLSSKKVFLLLLLSMQFNPFQPQVSL